MYGNVYRRLKGDFMKKELKNLRKRNEKHFLNEDGTIEALIYKNDVHYEKDGKYEEINNTLVLKNDRYFNIGNNFDVSFSTESDDKLLEIRKNEHYIKMNMKGSNRVKNKELKKDNIIRNVGSIEYNDIFPNIDVNYQIFPKKLKETIILKDKESIKEKIVFNIETDLKLELVNNKIVSNSDFYIDEPFMIDSNNEQNNFIYYELNKTKNGYDITLNLDVAWLECSERVFPIIIDPTIVVDSINKFQDTFISSENPDTNYSGSTELQIGAFGPNHNICRTLFKFDLPEIGTGNSIINAKLHIYNHPDYYPDLGTPYYVHVDAHQITADWNESTATWNNMHDKYNPLVEYDYNCEYSIIKDDNISFDTKLNIFDITNLVKKWYSGVPNYGIMFKAYDESEIGWTHLIDFISKENNFVPNLSPVISITYRNQNGLENYMTYTQKELINKKLYINNLNGNVILNYDLGNTVGGNFTVDLNLYYNTNDALEKNNYGFGLGNKLNLFQTLKSVTIQNENLYEYLDEDGTIHYFRKKSEDNNLYIDEDGLSLTLDISEPKLLMTDKYGNKKIFTNFGNIYYLTQILDLSGKTIDIIYSNNKIVKITDGSNNEINILYETNKISIVSSIKTVVLNFTNDFLTNVVDEIDNCNITYDTNGILSTISDINNKKITLEYYVVKPYKLKKISEYSQDNTLGNQLEFKYSFNSTIITNESGTLTTYTFNEFGNTVSITKMDESKKVEDAYGKIIEYQNNNIIQNGGNIKSINNLMWNSSFENDDITFKSSDVSVTYSEDKFISGTRCLKLNGKGNAYIDIKLEEVGYYTFSCFSITNTDSKLQLNLNNSVSEIVLPISNEFTRSNLTVYNAHPGDNLRISFNNDTNGILYIEDVQLEKGQIANLYNIADNSDFRYGAAGWQIEGHSYGVNEPIEVNEFVKANDEIINDGVNRYLKIDFCNGIPRTIRRFFNISGVIGDVYYVSFWYKNFSINSNNDEDVMRQKYNKIIMYFPTEGPSSPAIDMDIPGKYSEEWQYFSAYFTTHVDYSSFVLEFVPFHMRNYMYITNLNVIKGVKPINYDYDANDNLVKVATNNDSTFVYDPNNQLINVADELGTSFVYEYDNQYPERKLSSISATGICNKTKYDTNGNLISNKISCNSAIELNSGLYYIRLKGSDRYLKSDAITKQMVLKADSCSHAKWMVNLANDKLTLNHAMLNDIYLGQDLVNSLNFQYLKNDNGSFSLKYNDKYLTNVDNELILTNIENPDNQQFYFEFVDRQYIESNFEYTSDGKFLVKKIDELLNTITYDIDSTKGLIKKLVDPNNNVTTYNYNNRNQIINISKGNMKLNYEYINNLLKSIVLDNKTYNFTYDKFLNINSMNLNDNKLLENIFDFKTGNLIKKVYSNGGEMFYEYDQYSRLIKITQFDNVYEFVYDNFGNLGIIKDKEKQYRFYYDTAQRLIKYSDDDLCDISYSYNKLNNLVVKKININNMIFELQCEYNTEKNITKLILNDTIIEYIYDDLQRLVEVKTNNNSIYYGYVNLGNRTSHLIDTVIDGDNIYKYKYDKLGNISKIYKNNILQNEYYYDMYNQLVKEKDNSNIITYEYDNFGNILNKKIYDLDEILVDSVLYEYNNVNFKDQLTKYKDIQIIYDNIGNPIMIGNSNLSWTNGVQLNSFTSSDLNVTYKYNHDGIRTYKKVNNDIYHYYLEGETILCIQKNENMIYFIYDVDSKLIAVKYNGNLYYYEKNLQGDIVGIRDSNNVKIAAYQYDSFGKILSITDNSGGAITDINNIALINPFRYRSYYYDNETGLYYLNSRYYSPEWGRFLNPDSIISANGDIISTNLYSYCSNNYINFQDNIGNFISNVTPVYLYDYTYNVIRVDSSHYKINIYADNKIFTSQIDNNAMRFDFSNNFSYDNKYAYTISTAMFGAYNDIYGEKPEGRTVDGVANEIKLHSQVNNLTFKKFRKLNVADMGTIKNDNNAWVSEILQPPKILIKPAKKNNDNIFKKIVNKFFMLLNIK